MLQSEEDFIEQYARVLLVQWCLSTIDAGYIVSASSLGNGEHATVKITNLCVEHAVTKGWVGKSEPKKVLAKGFSTAAAFLKR